MRVLRLGAAAAVLVLALFMMAATRRASASTSGGGGVTLLSQSPWVEQKGIFRLQLAIRAPNPSKDQVQVLIFPPLRTRSDFNNAMQSQYATGASYQQTAQVSSLKRDPAGGVDADIAIQQTAPARAAFPAFEPKSSSSVYPVQVSLLDGSSTVGEPIDTFLVYALGPPSVTDNARLSVAVVVPFASLPVIGKKSQLQPLGSAESQRLSDVVSAFAAYPNVHVSVQASPETLQQLAAGDSTDTATLAALSSLAQAHDIQIVPSTYVPVSVSDLEAANLAGEISQQVQSGGAVLRSKLGVTPDKSTWVVDGPLDQATLGALTAQGATRLIVPDADLTPLGPADTFFGYFGYPTLLGPGISVYAGDPGLTADITRGDSPVLAANQLLADLAMVQTIQPGYSRGMVVLPSPGWVADPTFLTTLLAGLDGNPMVSAVTASQIFGVSSPPPGPITRALADPTPAIGDALLSTDSQTFRNARAEIDALSTVFSQEQALASQLQAQLLTAESAELTDAQRVDLLAAVSQSASKILREVNLPPESSITLTSTHGQIPLTILSSPSLAAKVKLDLTSPELIFQPFNPPNGHCQVPTPTREECFLQLTTENTTIKVPVQARSAGVFSLHVDLYSPDGAQQLDHNVDTVRSTAVSGVGVVLIVVAFVSLAIWWARDLHHGRRARRLVPSPIDLSVDDDAVEQFFRQPPPASL